jgi:hypothetical protein
MSFIYGGPGFQAFSSTGKNRTAPVEEAAEPDKVSDQSFLRHWPLLFTFK